MNDHVSQLIQPRGDLSGDRARQLSRRWSRANSELSAVVATYRAEAQALQQRLEQSRALLRAAEAELDRTRLNGTPATTEQDEDIARLRATATGPDDVFDDNDPDDDPDVMPVPIEAAPLRRLALDNEPPARVTLTREIVTRGALTHAAGPTRLAALLVDGDAAASPLRYAGGVNRRRTTLLFELANAHSGHFDSIDVIFDGQLSSSAPERPAPGLRVRITRPGVSVDSALETIASTHSTSELIIATDEAPGGVRRAGGRRVVDADTMFEMLADTATIGRE